MASLSVVKVRAHIIKNPDENEKNNNIADQLAKLAAQKGDEWKPDRLVVPAVSAIQTIPIDLKQYQQELWSSDGELTPHLQQDQLVKVTEGMILRDDKYIVPEALQKPVIKLYHDYAHVSAPKTQQLIQKNFWWPQMASDIQRWCDTCIVCATINQGKPGRTKLCRPEPPKGPWELLQLDFIGPLPSAKGGYRYCLVIIDKFSKWVEAIPTRNNSANTVARVVANQILPLWGAPIQIESSTSTLHRSGDETNMPDAEHQTKVSHTVSTTKLRHGGTCQPHNKRKHIKTGSTTQKPMDWCPTHSPNNTAGNSFKSHRYQSIWTHDWKSHEAAHRPRNCPSRPGAPRGCNSTVCAQAITREVGSATCTRCPETTAIRFNEWYTIQPNLWGKILRRRHGNGTRFCEARCIHTPMAWPIWS